MDGFTAQVLLSAALNGSSADRVADLYKDLSKGGGATPEVEAQVRAMIGKRCRVKHTPYVGVVQAFNESRGGMYGGDRFPVIVAVDKCSDGKPHVFEYGLEQVVVDDTA